MKVFVAGGTGAVGRYAVPALVAAGHDVSVIARSDEKAAQVEGQGAMPARVSLFEPEALASAAAGHEVVVNLATAIPPLSRFAAPHAWDENDRIRTEGAANLVDAALAGSAARFVQESVAFAYPESGDEWIDEDMPIVPVSMTESLVAAEASARRFSDAGEKRVAVVLRFGFFYGPGSVQTELLVKTARRHVGPAFGPADHWVGSIHLEDAGAAVAAALTAPGGCYNVVDEPVTWREYAEAVGQAVGEAPWLRVPGRLIALFGRRAGTLGRSQRVSNRRLREATGWAPRFPSVREGWPAVAAALDSAAGDGESDG
ncbi:MAG: NAD-dependent epimerase/dehydratase family protein [Acidimicrobiales bacterium]